MALIQPLIQSPGTTGENNKFPPQMTDLKFSSYDNDVTFLYKWAEDFQVPIRLIIVRQRTPEDAGIPYGTAKYIFESLPLIVQRLLNENETPSEIYDIITGINNLITIDDIAMVIYSFLHLIYPNNDLHADINQVYREMDNTLTIDKFDSQDDLQRAYDVWKSQNDERMAIDLKRLDTIKDIQARLAKIDELEKLTFSPITINSTITSFSPTIDGRPVVEADGLDIFNKVIPSKYVPFIRYNDEFGKGYFRLYTGGKIETEPNYNNTVIPSSETSAKNTIYMNLWLGDPNSDGTYEIHDAPRESFFTVVYHLSTNFITIEAPIGLDPKKGLIRSEQIAYQRAQTALPSLVFGPGTEVKVRGDFNIWGIDFDETSFLDMVLLEPLMNVYLYVEENIKPFALKKRLDVHYRSIFTDMAEGKTATDEAYISNSASVSITLTPKTTVVDEIVNIMDIKTKRADKARLGADTPYIHINISQAESRDIVNEFIPIFSLLMRYYLNNKEEVYEAYIDILPELAALSPLLIQRKKKTAVTAPNILQLTKKVTIKKRLDANIKILQEHAPDLFVIGYARKSQPHQQPMLIDVKDIEIWKQKRIGPTQKERQIMPFPANNPKYYFVCPEDENPYPGMKINKELPNKDIYPYLPSCGKRDQMSPGLKSKYHDYLAGKLPKYKMGAKADKKISTRKILSPDKIAFLPRAVENIVKRYSEDYIDMVRYGVLYTPNSLLHCVCIAVDDPNYLAQKSDELKEIYVTQIRQYMGIHIQPSLLKQELYDHTNQEILEILRDNSEFLDPSIFFRAIEETFNINIYVFTPPSPTGDETELGAMDVPRFKIFHARPLRLHRPTIVIMKTWGSESNNLLYPQCELIVDYDEDNQQIMKIFGPEMTEVCHSTLQDTLKTMTWSVNPNNSIEVHANIYYYIDHLNLFQAKSISQMIDDNGKMRALTLDFGNQQILTIATIPSQPENLPVTNEIRRVTAQLAIDIFGTPTAVTRDSNNNVDGLWFQIMDIVQGEYVPVIPSPGYDNIPTGFGNPVVSTGISVTVRLSKMKRTLNIIVQLTQWLYELARSKQNITPTAFVSQFMLMDQSPVQDSATYYNLSNIPRRLPNVETIQEAIKIMEPLAPTLFAQDRIVMYSAVFADRIIKMLKDFANLHDGIPPTQQEFIEGYYETENDFKEVFNAKLFINEKDLNAWMLSLKNSQNYSRYFNIRQKIEIAMSFTPDPYLYQDSDGKIYLIQNVIGGVRAKAMAVAKNWHDHRVNIGYEPGPLNEDEFPINMIYGISPASTLIPIEDNTHNNEIFIKLLYYGSASDKAEGKDARYAAMMDIL